MIPDIFKPYLDHPLVNSRLDDLEVLDSVDLNNIIRVEDLMIRGVREYYLKYKNTKRLNASAFSSSILLARGLAFLDVAHYKTDVSKIWEDVWRITPTTAKKPAFNQKLAGTIQKLDDDKLIIFDSEKKHVESCIPYAVGSKRFVQKNLIENYTLFHQQEYHYRILGAVQDFPKPKSELANACDQHDKFNRDYGALSEVDIIREREVKGIPYTFATGFVAGEKSAATWMQLLSDASDGYRVALKELMELQGEYGGFISHQEIVVATRKKDREISWIMRNVDDLGIAQMVRTLDGNALSRITSGTLLNMNYRDLNNAQSILVLTRQVPEAAEILNRFKNKKELVEDDLTEEYGAMPVQRTIYKLEFAGLIRQKGINEGLWELTPQKGNERFLEDVLTVRARSRHVLDPDYDVTNLLEESFKNMDEEKFRRGTEQLKLDYFKETVDEVRS
ncbi:MAG: hypothetical protein NTU95_04725 [Methanothrix sp.]|nr:hypothetical protein [Methanothrix sp.]